MRSDKTRSSSFVNADAWRNQKYKDKLFYRRKNGPPYFINNSFSGSEPNHLFLNDGKTFSDLTLVSGADHEGDGRGFAMLDFDNDGWLDIALVSTNAPRFKLLRNQLGEHSNNSSLRIKLSGSNQTPSPSGAGSNRDAIGAQVKIHYQSGRQRTIHHQAGEGNVAQNSATLSIGFQPDDPVDFVTVKWPSGNSQRQDELSLKEINHIRETSASNQ